MSGDPLREAAEARRRREAQAQSEQKQNEKERHERAVIIEQHREQARAMLATFLSKMRGAGYPGTQTVWVSRGFLRARNVRCWDGWLTTEGAMIGIPAGTHGRTSEEHVSSPDEWIPRRVGDIYHRGMGSTSPSTTPVESQLKNLAETLDRILAKNRIEI
jgi:hypothetical protein